MKIRAKAQVLLCLLPLLTLVTACSDGFLDNVPLSQPVAAQASRAYLNVVRDYADAMVGHGRDRYGAATSPLFASMLDRQTLSLFDDPKNTLVDLSDYGVRQHDRAWNASNPLHDLELYSLLYDLSETTGDPAYGREADAALAWFFENAQSPATDLMAWGEHLSWDFKNERSTVQTKEDQSHEMSQWDLWPEVYGVAPRPARDFAKGLWDHQIYDKTTGDFSRHAKYDRHAPGRYASFPRYGGNMIVAWAYAYANTTDEAFKAEMLGAIHTITDSYNGRRKGGTDALPVGTGSGFENTFWTGSSLDMAAEVWRAAALLPQATAEKLRGLAVRSDNVILSLVHNFDGHVSGQPEGFLSNAYADTLQPGDPRGYADQYYSTMWELGYGAPITSATALAMLERYEQTGISEYRALALEAAERYLSSAPDKSTALHPGALSAAIDLMLEAHRLTNESRYLERAGFFGQEAYCLFMDESSPLPKVTSLHNHYETITGGDDLMLAFLNLHRAGGGGVRTDCSSYAFGVSYYVVSKANGRYLANDAAENDAELWSPNTLNTRKWELTNADEGHVYLVSEENGKYLANDTAENDAELWSPSSLDTRKWALVDAGEGYVYVVSKANGRYLANDTAENDAELWSPSALDTRKWELIRVNE